MSAAGPVGAADRPASLPQTSPAGYGRAVTAVLVAAGLFLLWQLSNVLLLAFAAVLVAVLVLAVAELLSGRLRVPQGLSVLASVLLILATLGGVAALFGTQIAGQISEFIALLPQAAEWTINRLGLDPAQIESAVAGEAANLGRALISRAAWFGNALISGLATAVLVAIAGVYIAMAPRDYRVPLLTKLGPGTAGRVRSFLTRSNERLRQWLIAQLISMAIVGTLMGLGAWAIGLPAPVALGLIAGILEFVPVVGPWLGAVPVVLFAAAQDWTTVLWAIGLVLAVQQLESNMIIPLVMRGMVDLQPAVVLFAVLAFGSLFGVLGIFLAVPLTIVLTTLIDGYFENGAS